MRDPFGKRLPTPAEPNGHAFPSGRRYEEVECSLCGVTRKVRRGLRGAEDELVFGFLADGPWWPELSCEPLPQESWHGREIVMFDVETNGLDWARDEVIEIAAARGNLYQKDDDSGTFGVKVGETFQSLVKPRVMPSQIITDITKITPAMLEDAPDARTVVTSLTWFLDACPEDAIFAAYNASFDVPFVVAMFLRSGLPTHRILTQVDEAFDPFTWAHHAIDPFIWVQSVDRYVKGKTLPDGTKEGRHKLVPTARRWGLFDGDDVTATDRAHRADYDAVLALRVLAALAHKVPSDVSALRHWQRAARGEWSSNFFGSYLPNKKMGDHLEARNAAKLASLAEADDETSE